MRRNSLTKKQPGQEEECVSEVEQENWLDITKDEVQAALRKSQKSKSPGIDKKPNFWLNSLLSSHENVAQSLNYIMERPEETPDWLTEGLTYLLPKTDDTKNPKNYRPITSCLTTTYKLLTSIITERMHNFLETNSILPQEQKGCRRNSYGCKDRLLMKRMLLKN